MKKLSIVLSLILFLTSTNIFANQVYIVNHTNIPMEGTITINNWIKQFSLEAYANFDSNIPYQFNSVYYIIESLDRLFKCKGSIGSGKTLHIVEVKARGDDQTYEIICGSTF